MCATTKYVSESCTSTGTEPRKTPEMPPIVNTTMNAIAKSIAVRKRRAPPQSVPSQEKIFTPVGTAMSIVDAMKKICSAGSMPATNMWCTKTPNERKPIAADEYAIIRYPKIGLRAQREDRHDHVQGAEDRRETEDGEAEDQKVHALRRGELLRGERHVDRPSGGRRSGDERGVEDDAARQQQPVGQGVETREGHVPCAELQRDDEVRETGPDGDDEEEDHRRPVHREERVVLLRREKARVRRRQLGADP